MRSALSGFVASGEPDLDAATECPCCGFDAVLTFPMLWVRESEVITFATYSRCVRCLDEGCTCSR